jgi:hypothetical protein
MAQPFRTRPCRCADEITVAYADSAMTATRRAISAEANAVAIGHLLAISEGDPSPERISPVTCLAGGTSQERGLDRTRLAAHATRLACGYASAGGSEPLAGYRYGNDPNRTASQAVTVVSQACDSAADRSISLSVMGMGFRAG